MNAWHDVGAADEFEPDEPRGVTAAGVAMAICRVGDELFALADRCTHEVARLSEGFIEDGCIECPLHQGTFDLRTGEARKAPCVDPVQVYSTRVVGGRLQVQVQVQVLPIVPA